MYGGAIYFWRDPVTDVYQRWKQHQLAGALDETFREFRVADTTPAPSVVGGDTSDLQLDLAADAQSFEAGLELGDPIGRIKVADLDLSAVFVHGTRWGADLTRGPGHYAQTSLPGLDRVTAIAGHRTTFGAPFRHIDRLEAGDLITLELPYGTFEYRVFSHEIVDDGDWSIIEPRGFDALVLSACHPLFSASQRWIVYARLIGVETPDGASYTVTRGGELASA